VKKKVLFLCSGNSCRSQMAEGLLRHIDPGRYEVFSAGIRPTSVHPNAIKVMHEIGIDISEQFSKSVDQLGGRDFDIVVTVCDSLKEMCPVFASGARRIHWPFVDPAAATGTQEQILDVFRTVRDQIEERITNEFGPGRLCPEISKRFNSNERGWK